MASFMAPMPWPIVAFQALHPGRLRLLFGRRGTGEGWPCLGPSQLCADAGTTGGVPHGMGTDMTVVVAEVNQVVVFAESAEVPSTVIFTESRCDSLDQKAKMM